MNPRILFEDRNVITNLNIDYKKKNPFEKKKKFDRPKVDVSDKD